MITETKRLLLREMNPDDFQALFRVLGDPEIMGHYPYTFDRQRVRDWIERNMNHYCYGLERHDRPGSRGILPGGEKGMTKRDYRNTKAAAPGNETR